MFHFIKHLMVLNFCDMQISLLLIIIFYIQKMRREHKYFDYKFKIYKISLLVIIHKRYNYRWFYDFNPEVNHKKAQTAGFYSGFLLGQ